MSPPAHLRLIDRFRRFQAQLEKHQDGASLAAFRVMFGLLMFWEVARYFWHGWIERYYIAPTFHFTYPPFEFLKPWPGIGMYIHFGLLGFLALLIALGLFYRPACLLFFLGFSYVFLIDKAYYLNHFYLIALLSFLLILVPAHRTASLDRRFFFPQARATVPGWSLFLLRAQVFIVYFYAGLAKLNPDWLSGEPMRMWLTARTDLPLLGSLAGHDLAPYVFSYGGLAFDLSIIFLLVWRRTRAAGLVLAATFHTLNGWLFEIGVFPYLAFGMLLLFAEPDWPRRLLSHLRTFIIRLQPQFSSRAPHFQPDEPLRGAAPSRGALLFLHAYLIVQLLVPLRHWLYPGRVSWTEEGHRFSWRMKLRDKEAELRVFATDPRTGETREISPAAYLSSRQLDEMSTRPDMVVQFSRFLADELTASRGVRPKISVDLGASLNGRLPQPLIDPDTDLAQVDLGMAPATWILPLQTPVPAQSVMVEADP